MRGNSALDLRKDLADAFRSHFGSVGRGDEEQVFCGRGIGFFGSCAEDKGTGVSLLLMRNSRGSVPAR